MDYESILKAANEQPEYLYRTERGSAYGHFKDNTTIRNRSSEKHRDTTTGIQPRSGKTVYLNPADVNRVAGLFQNADMATRFVPMSYDPEAKAGKVGLVLAEDFGPKKAGTVLHEASFTTVPKTGLNPVEIYKSDSPRGESGRGVHWGNRITEVRGMGGGSRDLQLGADLDPKAMMRKYAGGGTVQMPQDYSVGSWKLI